MEGPSAEASSKRRRVRFGEDCIAKFGVFIWSSGRACKAFSMVFGSIGLLVDARKIASIFALMTNITVIAIRYIRHG